MTDAQIREAVRDRIRNSRDFDDLQDFTGDLLATLNQEVTHHAQLSAFEREAIMTNLIGEMDA